MIRGKTRQDNTTSDQREEKERRGEEREGGREEKEERAEERRRTIRGAITKGERKILDYNWRGAERAR